MRITSFIVLFFCSLSVWAGEKSSPHDIEYFDFIQYKKNTLQYAQPGRGLQKTFQRLEDIELWGKGDLKILHIGDSHIQAGFIDAQLRENIQHNSPFAAGDRGVVFPYKVAKTNGPWDFSHRWTGVWNAYKNVSYSHLRPIGLAGITLSTLQSNATITVKPSTVNENPNYFSNVKVFHSFGGWSFDIDLDTSCGVKYRVDYPEKGYSEFVLQEAVSTFKLTLKKGSNQQNRFDLYGFEVGANKGGISLSSIGVNGAEVGSWNRSELLMKHVQAIKPDLIIVSLGTNDCYPARFDEEVFADNYRTLLTDLKKVLPECEFVLTTPGDHYRSRVVWNENLLSAVDVVKSLSKEFNAPYWDFFEVMGGKNAILKWKISGLAGADLLHYTSKGYKLQGDLLYSAMMKEYEKYLQR